MILIIHRVKIKLIKSIIFTSSLFIIQIIFILSLNSSSNCRYAQTNSHFIICIYIISSCSFNLIIAGKIPEIVTPNIIIFLLILNSRLFHLIILLRLTIPITKIIKKIIIHIIINFILILNLILILILVLWQLVFNLIFILIAILIPFEIAEII